MDQLVAELARRQHGVVARGQLAALGLTRGAVEHRLRTGRLHRLHRGVYAVGHRALTRRAQWMAAVLAAGPGAVLGHRSAAALLDLRPDRPGPVEVVTPRVRRSRPGIAVHTAALPPDERAERDGIPVTTRARTILDLAVTAGAREAERALNEAETADPAIREQLAALLARCRSRRGAAIVRALVADPSAGIVRSELEERFLALARAAGLPPPSSNLRVAVRGRRFELDCAWASERIAVELDGRAFHTSAAAFERDRVRDRALLAAGWRVVRVTWRQLRDEPAAVVADLRALLDVDPRAAGGASYTSSRTS